MFKRRIAAVSRVELCRGVVRRTGPLWPLVRLMASSSRDERNTTFSEQFPQRRERHLQVVRPLVDIGVTQCLVPTPRTFYVTHGLIVLRSEGQALRLVCLCHGRPAFVIIGAIDCSRITGRAVIQRGVITPRLAISTKAEQSHRIYLPLDD